MATINPIVSLYSTTLASAASSVYIANIPTNEYRDLRVVVSSVSSATAESYAYLYFNNDTAANYSRVEMSANGSSPGSGASSNLIPITMPASNSGIFGVSVVDIMDAFVTDKQKVLLYRNDTPNSTVVVGAGRWASNAAINLITLTAYNNQFGAGTTISIYGIKA